MSQAPGLSRNARLRPLLERGDERVLREVLGQADVAHDPREAGDEPARDSIRQTASIARWVSVAVTATDHTIFNPSVQAAQKFRGSEVQRFRGSGVQGFGFRGSGARPVGVPMSATRLDSSGMLLTIRTTHRPATDLGFLLHKHPEHVHTREFPFGSATVFYPGGDG